MAAHDDNNNYLDIEIAVIKSNIEQITNAIKDFRDIAKEMSETSTNIQKLLSNHDLKLAQQEKMLEKIQIDAEIRKRESEASVREIKTQMNGSFNDAVRRDSDAFQRISVQIKDMEESHEKAIEKIYNAIEENKTTHQKEIEGIKTRITSLENWKWYTTGIAAVVVFIASKIPWNTLF